MGDEDARSRDVLGRVYEYFLSQFASAEGKKGGEFYTPRCVVRVLVEMLEPYRGRVYDPCCGSSGMFVQSNKFVRAHASGNGNGGRTKADISIYGQESNYTTWRLAKMNLAIRGIEGQIAHGDSFHNDRHPDLKADYILANPPFNVSDWGGERLADDKRWALRGAAEGQRQLRLGAAPWSTTSRPKACGGFRPGERVDVVEPIRRGDDPEEPDRGGAGGQHGRPAGAALLLDADSGLPLVPGAAPHSARRDSVHRRPQTRPNGGPHAPRVDRRRHRPHRWRTYHAWRERSRMISGTKTAPASARALALDEVRRHGHVLTPGRYVGAEPQPDDGEPFEAKMGRLVAELQAQQDRGRAARRRHRREPEDAGFPFRRGGPMTVSELIETLKAHPGDLRVVVNGYEEGYDDLSPRQISVVPIVLNTGVHNWEGRHGEPGDAPGDATEPSKVVDALVLRRVSN